MVLTMGNGDANTNPYVLISNLFIHLPDVDECQFGIDPSFAFTGT